MFNELKEMFNDDYIYTKRFCIKPFTLLWWIIRTGQTMLIVAGLWMFYVLMYAVLV